ncbi:MAG TPA: hypothetical protein VME23_05940 [Terracidiphilus sp.]|nr:hypothetical protein [Terracidiphilus sp.]
MAHQSKSISLILSPPIPSHEGAENVGFKYHDGTENAGFKPNFLRFKPESNRRPEDPDFKINADLWSYQEQASDWTQAERIEFFHLFIRVATARFSMCFKLPVITIEDLEVRTVAKYYAGRNGLGLLNQIAINLRYLISSSPDDHIHVLASLTTCLLQAQLHENMVGGSKIAGRVDYFPADLVAAADRLGIRIDRQGHVFGIRPGPFLNLLIEGGMHIDWIADGEERHFQTLAGKMRRSSGARVGMRKWVCPCRVILRHAGDDLQAVCLRCNQLFHKDDA